MSNLLVHFYLHNLSNVKRNYSFLKFIEEHTTMMSRLYLDNLQALYNALPEEERGNLTDVCKLKALFHLFMVDELHGRRLLNNNETSTKISSTWKNPNILSQLYEFGGHSFAATFNTIYRVPDIFVVTVMSRTNTELIDTRSINAMPTLIPDNRSSDEDRVIEILAIFFHYFYPFVQNTAMHKTRKRPASGDCYSSESSKRPRDLPPI